MGHCDRSSAARRRTDAAAGECCQPRRGFARALPPASGRRRRDDARPHGRAKPRAPRRPRLRAPRALLDRETDEPVALKVMLGAATRDLRDRFLREARLLSELRHPAIVRYVESGVTPAGEAWLAMEWLEGEGLDMRLGR